MDDQTIPAQSNQQHNQQCNQTATTQQPIKDSPYHTHQTLSKVKNLIIGRNTVLGEFASHAVQQSPYTVPDNLQIAIEKLEKMWPVGDYNPEYKEFYEMGDVRNTLSLLFDQIPEVLAWNERKNGKQGMGFSSRHDQPTPDDDFIDLHALARNIAMAVWKDAVNNKASDDDFDRRYKNHLETGKPMETGA